MAKLTLLPITNLQNENSVVTAINTNSDRIEAALENTLSRDGTTPNEMNSPLDMNNNRIFNLPKALTGTEPIRYQDFQDLAVELKGEKGDKGDPGGTGPIGPQGPAGASAEGANSYPTYAAVEAATIAPEVDYIVLNGYAALGDGGQVHAKKVVSEPTHPFKVKSDNNVWFEMIPDPYYRPEMVGHMPNTGVNDLFTFVQTLETVLPQAILFLSENDWYLSDFPNGSSVRLVGPGAERAMYHSTWHRIGIAQENERGVNPRVRALTTGLHMGDSSSAPKFATGLRSTALGVLTSTSTNVSFDDGVDAMGGFRTAYFGGVYNPPGSGRYFIFTPGEARAVRVSGFVTFADNATGVRQVTVIKNGSAFVKQNTVPALSSGLATTVPFDTGIIACAPFDNFGVQVYQTSGTTLNVIQASVTVEVVATDSKAVPKKPMKVFQGVWQTLEDLYPTWREFVEAMSQYGVLVLSHPDVIGAPPNPWADTNRGKLIPGVATPEFPNVLDYGYTKFKRLINDVKTLNPECIIFGYVSPAVDCEWVSSGGNPCRPSTFGAPGAFEDPLGSGNYWVNDKTWDPGGHPNFRQWVDLWTRDKNLPIDGLFMDHYANVFTTETVRDECTRIIKSKGLKVMGNITFAAADNVTWAASCPYLSYGDYFALEGFYRDGALDTLSGTLAVIGEMLKLAPRGLWLCALCEEVPPIKGNPLDFSKGASYYQVGTAVTVTTNNSIGGGIAHGMVTGDKVYIETGPGPLPSGLYTVQGSTAYTFTLISPVASAAIYSYLDVYTNSLSATEMNNNSVNNLNGRSLFNNYYIPGWVYDYGRTSVDTLGTPAI